MNNWNHQDDWCLTVKKQTQFLKWTDILTTMGLKLNNS